MNQAIARLKKEWDEDPTRVLFALALVAGGAAKLMQANTARLNAKTYRMETQRRMMNVK
jgi:hypothetical protein